MRRTIVHVGGDRPDAPAGAGGAARCVRRSRPSIGGQSQTFSHSICADAAAAHRTCAAPFLGPHTLTATASRLRRRSVRTLSFHSVGTTATPKESSQVLNVW